MVTCTSYSVGELYKPMFRGILAIYLPQFDAVFDLVSVVSNSTSFRNLFRNFSADLPAIRPVELSPTRPLQMAPNVGQLFLLPVSRVSRPGSAERFYESTTMLCFRQSRGRTVFKFKSMVKTLDRSYGVDEGLLLPFPVRISSADDGSKKLRRFWRR